MNFMSQEGTPEGKVWDTLTGTLFLTLKDPPVQAATFDIRRRP